MAKITYCAYDYNKKLVPRPGYPKVVEPLHLMWSNGYYYLLVYNEKYGTIVNLRVDRITDIEEIETESSCRVDEFNPVQYRHEHPVMFGGEKEKIVLLCRCTDKNYFMNTIMDVFGKNARVTLAKNEVLEQYLHHPKEYYDYQKITWLQVMIETSAGGVVMWATQYCNDCRIISPVSLAEQVKKRLEQGLCLYQ